MNTSINYLQDARKGLRDLMVECLDHIKNNTFDEDVFVKCFGYFFWYTDILAKNGVNDDLNTTPMTRIQDYYNEKSNMYTYDIVLRTKKR